MEHSQDSTIMRSAALLCSCLTDPVLREWKPQAKGDLWEHSHSKRMERKDSGVGCVPNIIKSQMKRGATELNPTKSLLSCLNTWTVFPLSEQNKIKSEKIMN